MKIFLASPDNAWMGTGSNRREWERFAQSFATSAPAGTVVSAPSLADAVIHSSHEQLDSAPLGRLARPLSGGDVRHVVWDWGDRPTGRHSGFYCSLPFTLFDTRRHRTICYPLDFNELIENYPQSDARFDFGFMGGLTSSLRIKLLRQLGPRQDEDNSVIRVQGANWQDIAAHAGGAAKEQYATLVRSCRFVLCPRGYGLGTARMFETMKAGRVPVIISDGYVLPAGIDWSSCALVVSERNISRIPDMIRDAVDDWPRLAARARSIWVERFAPASVAGYMVEQLKQFRYDDGEPQLWRRYTYSAKVLTAAVVEKIRPLAGRMRDRLRLGGEHR